MHKVLTFGYQGRRPQELLALADAEGAVVVDVRIKPWSRLPGWSQKALQELLGERYVWVRELGNQDYKGTGVRLVDEEAGLAKVREMLESRPVILLCFESDETRCHRRHVRRRLEVLRSV
jgi:uncharacterized protein (DUF488 family)